MSQRVVLVDDLDGTEADATVLFGFEGKSYEIDLSTKNAQQLEKTLGKYISVARLVKTGSTGRRLREVKTSVDSKAVRAWAKANGIEVNQMGTLPKSVIDQYREAGN